MALVLDLQQPYSVETFASSIDKNESKSVIKAVANSGTNWWSDSYAFPRTWELLEHPGYMGTADVELRQLVAQYMTALDGVADSICQFMADDDQVTVRLKPRASSPIQVRNSTERGVLRAVLDPDDC